MTNAFDLYKEANRLVRKYHTRDPMKIAQELGIRVFYSNELGNLLGLYTYMIRNRVIILNSKLGEYQKIMVLAHEIGHDRFHKEYAQTGLQEYQIFDMCSSTEYDANAFAAHLLIDTEEIIEFIRSGQYDLWGIASSLNVNINLVLIKMQELNRMGYNIPIPIDHNPKFFNKETPDGDNDLIS